MRHPSLPSTSYLASIVLAVVSTAPGALSAQVVDGSVKASQAATVSQTIAEAEITIVYNRPVARGRRIFGNLVPWDVEWNPGADQATHIETSADLRLGDETLKAGSYSVWAIPGEREWTLLFHRSWDVFHAPYPGDQGVELRLQVTPRHAPHMETLAFYFPVVDRRDASLVLHWGETLIEVPIHVPDPTGG